MIFRTKRLTGEDEMPRKKKKKSKSILILLILIGVSISIIAWHDGMLGATSVDDINNGDVPNGTVVTIRAKMSGVVLNEVAVTDIDGSGGLVFSWEGAKPATDSIVVIKGIVSSPITLDEVTQFEIVWLFK